MLLKLGSLLSAAFGSLLAALSAGIAHSGLLPSWSATVRLGGCRAASPAAIVFPSDSPRAATGPGAVVWGAERPCGQGEVLVAPVGAGDSPRAATAPAGATGARIAIGPPLAAAPGPHGDVVIAGRASAAASSRVLVIQGRAGGRYSQLAALPGATSQVTLATGYLGDVAIGALVGGPDGRLTVQVRTERYFRHAFSAPEQVTAPGAGPASALAVALDYRSDATAAWWRANAIYVRDLPASAQTTATQRVATTGAGVSLALLRSDDNRAIVAWSQQQGPMTSVYVDISAPGVRFGRPQLLESFRDPHELATPGGSPRLVRLTSESVMMAWTGAQDGRWVVRTAAVDLNGVHAITTASATGSDAVLAGLAPGPHGEAIAVWTAPALGPASRPDFARQAIYAARGVNAYPGLTIFAKPELVSGAGSNGAPEIAIDPATDRALAAWPGQGGGLRYAIRHQAKL